MARLPSLVLIALLLTPAAGGEDRPRQTELVERILAVVDERPLFLSEVRTVEVLRGLPPPAALEAAIDERLMYAEASRLPQAHVSEAEVDEAYAVFAHTRDALESRVPLAEVRRLLRRQATVRKYIEFRFRPQVRITPMELRRAWEEEGGGAGADLAAAGPALRARLERRAIDERIEEWVADLRARAEVRYVADEGPPPGS